MITFEDAGDTSNIVAVEMLRRLLSVGKTSDVTVATSHLPADPSSTENRFVPNEEYRTGHLVVGTRPISSGPSTRTVRLDITCYMSPAGTSKRLPRNDVERLGEIIVERLNQRRLMTPVPTNSGHVKLVRSSADGTLRGNEETYLASCIITNVTMTWRLS